MQEERLTNEGRHHLLLLHKQVHNKRGIAESLYGQITRYRHAHHVPYAEHVERSDEMVKHGRDDVKDFEDVSGTPCCPPLVLFTAQRAKLSHLFNGQNYL